MTCICLFEFVVFVLLLLFFTLDVPVSKKKKRKLPSDVNEGKTVFIRYACLVWNYASSAGLIAYLAFPSAPGSPLLPFVLASSFPFLSTELNTMRLSNTSDLRYKPVRNLGART